MQVRLRLQLLQKSKYQSIKDTIVIVIVMIKLLRYIGDLSFGQKMVPFRM